MTAVPNSPNSHHRCQENTLEHLFDRAPMGTAVFDRAFHLQWFNPVWARFIGCCANIPGDKIAPGCSLADLSPEIKKLLKQVKQRVLAGEVYRAENVRCENQGVVSYWDSVFTPIMTGNRITGILNILIDVSERALAEQQREQEFTRLQESEATLRSLIENAVGFGIYRAVIAPEQPYGAKITLVSPSICEIVGIDDASEFASWFENLHPDDRERVVQANRDSVERGVPYNQYARFYNKVKKEWAWVHTLSNPHFDENGKIAYFDGMVIDVTGQMNLKETERLRKAAEGLREIIEIINSNRPLQEILDAIAVQANQLLQASSTMIRHVSIDEDTVSTVASYNLPAAFEQIRTQPLYRASTDRLLLSRQPVAVTDVTAAYTRRLQDPTLTDPLQRAGIEATLKHYKSMLKVPLFVKDDIYGAITFHFEEQRTFRQEDIHLAMILADQSALAIENARLMEQIKETAVMEERNRLARELHDAVTQTLFSTTLIAEVLPKLWERSPAEGIRRMEELRQLTRGALAEMRTLLLELRPAALADTDLPDLLRHLTNAFIGRARVPVLLQLEGQHPIPLDAKVALYRIAQESLNNIAKHAEASQVTVSYQCSEDQVELIVADDGQGFDPENLPPDHLGLGIMRERAAQIGAQLAITSSPGHGTQVRVHWKPEPE